jgi:hypothetical protein
VTVGEVLTSEFDEPPSVTSSDTLPADTLP